MDRVWTPVSLIRWTEAYLEGKGFAEARLNAELLLAGVLGLKRLDLYLQFDRPLAPAELAEFKTNLKRRLRSEPIQYILGTTAFRELTLRVDRRALVPRPETEVLVGEVLGRTGGGSGMHVIDIGTGSGAIALSLGKEGSFDRIVATDISPPALELARENERCARLERAIEFRLGPVYQPVAGERFDVIVSNPPYVAEQDRGSLDPEVVEWEPQIALFAGSDGMMVIRDLVDGAAEHLNPGGLLAIEIGSQQGIGAVGLIRNTGDFAEPVILPDLAGRERFVVARRR